MGKIKLGILSKSHGKPKNVKYSFGLSKMLIKDYFQYFYNKQFFS